MRHWHVYLTIIAVLCGTLFAWVYTTQAKYRTQSTQARNSNLVQVVRNLELSTHNLENEIAGLRDRLEAFRVTENETGEMDELNRSWEAAKMEAGLVDLEGPGITVTLNDDREGALRAQASKPDQYHPEDYIIHDKNLLYLVNELKSAGAEAVAINGQHLVAYSDIRCVGTAILVNATRLVPPYKIDALGDPEQMARAIENGQEYPFLKGKGFPVALEKKALLVIASYRGSLTNSHLSPYEATPEQVPIGAR